MNQFLVTWDLAVVQELAKGEMRLTDSFDKRRDDLPFAYQGNSLQGNGSLLRSEFPELIARPLLGEKSLPIGTTIRICKV